MRKNIKLFINNQEVDYSEELSLPITHTLEDFKNPTIVKNSFSKSISIPGSKNNNKIFGDIYKLDRFLASHPNSIAGVTFDPSKRVDFQLFDNGSLIESGYMQLNSISMIDKVVYYNITLYGGLGDFFYNLKYDKEGNQRTLADLQFFVEDEDGNVLDRDNEFDFRINKYLVEDCFNYHPTDDSSNTLKDFLTFIPAYNGVYENFDNETCLVNTNEDDVFTKVINADGKTYTPFNGYGVASLNNAYTEWDIRDLRSYKQRPALKVSKLLKTICREENSGYKVNFDYTFFNSGNPYWSKSYIALPLLGSNNKDEGENVDNGKVYKGDNNWVGIKDNDATEVNNLKVGVSDATNVTTTDYIVDMSSLPAGSLTDIDIPIQVQFTPEDGKLYLNRYLYLSYALDFNLRPVRTSFTAQVIVYDNEDDSLIPKPIAYSPLYNFTSATLGGDPLSGPDTWVNYQPYTNAPVETFAGVFELINGKYVFKSSSTGGNVFHLLVTDLIKVNQARIVVQITRKSSGNDNILPVWSKQYLHSDEVSNYAVDGYISVDWNTNNTKWTSNWSSTVVSDILINKQTLLRTESTPADFLLSYSKLFGLYFIKDVDSKTITICSRNNFFRNKINDWSDRIDYSKDMTVNPILFDKKWYKMAYPTVDTYFSKRYNKEYDLVYGQKRLNTGYEFNAETTELYSDNIYENLVSAKDTSKYYRNFYSTDNKSVPGFLLDNATYKLYNNNDRADSTDLEIYGSKLLDITKTVEWSNIPGNDVTTKLCFYNLDGDTKSLSEIKSALVLYDGYELLNDVMDNKIVYHITDDVSEMSLLNEKPCYLYTNSEYNTAGDRIAIRINVLPKFVRYTSASNNVKYSLDFGLPKEIYEKLDYSENATVYNKFWDNFYKDQFNINTKKLTCFVKLNDLWVSNELLREFYYFANSYWLLNKIEGFDINSDITTRCEFIKVQEIDNYTQGISQFDEFIQFDPATSVVDHNAGSITINVQSNIPWKVGFYSNLKITNITPKTGTAGITPVTIEYTKNTTYNNDFFYARFTPENSNDGPSFDIKQLPNLDNVVTVSGTVKYRSGVKPEWDPTICAIAGTFTNCVIVRGNTYKMYVPKNTAFNIEIQGEYSAIIETKSVGALTEDYIIDWTI